VTRRNEKECEPQKTTARGSNGARASLVVCSCKRVINSGNEAEYQSRDAERGRLGRVKGGGGIGGERDEEERNAREGKEKGRDTKGYSRKEVSESGEGKEEGRKKSPS
jgi:hypothetical protein